MDIITLINDFAQDTHMTAENNGVKYYAVPFFHLGFDESISLAVREEGNLLYFTDYGTTYDYWEYKGIDLDAYADKIKRVVKMFDLTQDGKKFGITIDNYSSCNTRYRLCQFLEGLCVLAHIDL